MRKQTCIAKDIKSAQESLTEYKKGITLNRADKNDVMDQFRLTLIRFDHLTEASQ